MTFRSEEYHSYFCDGLTVLEQLRKEDGSLLDNVINVFNRSSEDPSIENSDKSKV